VPAPPRQKLELERAAPPAERPAPPVERPKATVTPPVAAPSPHPPRQATPPGGQPAILATPPRAVPSEREALERADSVVLNRAQGAAPPPAAGDEDPFFAELRAAMLDQSPLGPREDDDAANESAS
jgi:hypothetical protein